MLSVIPSGLHFQNMRRTMCGGGFIAPSFMLLLLPKRLMLHHGFWSFRGWALTDVVLKALRIDSCWVILR